MVDHAMICHMGSFPTIHHNEICDITATLKFAAMLTLNRLFKHSVESNLTANADDGALEERVAGRMQ